MLGKITDNIEGKLDKHCVMRWTVSAVFFRKIMENYQALLQFMRDSLKDKLNFEIKSQIVGCKKELESLSFFFGLNLS